MKKRPKGFNGGLFYIGFVVLLVGVIGAGWYGISNADSNSDITSNLEEDTENPFLSPPPNTQNIDLPTPMSTTTSAYVVYDELDQNSVSTNNLMLVTNTNSPVKLDSVKSPDMIIDSGIDTSSKKGTSYVAYSIFERNGDIVMRYLDTGSSSGPIELHRTLATPGWIEEYYSRPSVLLDENSDDIYILFSYYHHNMNTGFRYFDLIACNNIKGRPNLFCYTFYSSGQLPPIAPVVRSPRLFDAKLLDNGKIHAVMAFNTGRKPGEYDFQFFELEKDANEILKYGSSTSTKFTKELDLLEVRVSPQGLEGIAYVVAGPPFDEIKYLLPTGVPITLDKVENYNSYSNLDINSISVGGVKTELITYKSDVYINSILKHTEVRAVDPYSRLLTAPQALITIPRPIDLTDFSVNDQLDLALKISQGTVESIWHAKFGANNYGINCGSFHECKIINQRSIQKFNPSKSTFELSDF